MNSPAFDMYASPAVRADALMTSRAAVATAPVRSINQPVIDYYRCPEHLVDFEVAGRLSDEPGYFGFGPETTCYGRSLSGCRSPRGIGPLHDALPDVAVDGGTVRLPLDPNDVIDNLRHERYRHHEHRNGAGLTHSALVRTLYYWLRPCLGVRVRRHAQRAYLRDWKQIPFPRWPIDRTVERVLERLLVLSMKAQAVQTMPFVWFWPDRATSCAMMTHDVEGLTGRNFCSQLMDLDDRAGIKSAFQIVPEGRYAVPDGLLEEIRCRGFEINVHDLNHSGRLFSSREDFYRLAERINEYGSRYGALGFRSGALYRNQAWFDVLKFSYDMSVPSVAHLDPQRGGCCSVMPFFIGKILELPVTTIQDYSLFHILNDYAIDLWKQQLASITDQHGLASFIVHPDYLIEARARASYQALLEHLARMREERNVWIALPREVDRWWRQRNQMTVVRDGGRWRVEGPGKERARLAFATLVDDTLTFTIDDQHERSSIAPVRHAS